MRILTRILTLATVLFCMAPSLASAQFYVEGLGGFRAFSGDAREIAGGGLVLGGAVGYLISPYVAMEGRVDFGIHSEGTIPAEESSRASLALLFRTRVLPFASQSTSIEPFLVGQVGRGGLGWDSNSGDDDGISSWIFGLGGGIWVPIADNFNIGAEGVFNFYSWDDKTNDGIPLVSFDGNDFTFVGTLTVFFR